MRLSTLVLSLASLVSALPGQVDFNVEKSLQKQPVFLNKVIFAPPPTFKDLRVLYARSVQFNDGSLLATWEDYSPEGNLPIYRSTNGGQSWKVFSHVRDKQKKWGLRYQPFLYILPNAFAGYRAGTVLLAANSDSPDLTQTQIDVYVSTDRGLTWTFASHLASGGAPKPVNGETPVWEPSLLLHTGRLIAYYSDQRDPHHGQKMVHQTTLDLKTWAPPVDDVAYADYTQRPGMPIVAKLPNGRFIMTYEYGGSPAIIGSYQFPAYFKIASNPEKFGAAQGVMVQAEDGTIPKGSPYVTWTPFGGANGMIIVGAHSDSAVFINKGLGQGPWIKKDTGAAPAYSRHLRVLNNDPSKLLIMGAGEGPPTDGTNVVKLSVVDMHGW